MTSLRAARAQRVLSIRELAERASVAPSTIYPIEAGHTTPRARVVRSLATAHGLEPREIDEFKRTIDSWIEGARRRKPRRRADG